MIKKFIMMQDNFILLIKTWLKSKSTFTKESMIIEIKES